MKNRKGASIVELLVILAIIIALILLLLPAIQRARQTARETKARNDAINAMGPMQSTDQEAKLKETYRLPECEVISNLGNGWIIFEIEIPQKNVIGEVTEEEGNKKTILYHYSSDNFVELSKD